MQGKGSGNHSFTDADVLLPALLNSLNLVDRSPYKDSYVEKTNKGFKLERFSDECILFYFTKFILF